MLSPNSAVKAEKLGYTNVKVFHGGLPSWKKGKNTVMSSAKGLKNFVEQGIPYVAIDLRGRDALSGGVIPGAVNIPAAELAAAAADMPKQKSAPIVLYSDNAAEAVEAFSAVRGWGYKNASVLQGGAASWAAAGGEMAVEPLPAIAYSPKPRPGAVSIEEFHAIASGRNKDGLILDVRGADEVAEGMIPGAVGIPVTELEARLGELPKDKLIVCQCNTGVQAEMAYTMLKDAGFNVKFLGATIEIDDDGEYDIEEPEDM